MYSILHIGNIAGVPQEISKVQRKMGFKSDVLSFDNHPFDYEIDLFYPTKLPAFLRLFKHIRIIFTSFEKMYCILKISHKYNIFHFHFSSILPFGLDIPIWKMLNKKVIIHHHGSDIRYRKEFWMYLNFADKIIVSTPDLLEWSPNAVWVPNPISLDDFPFVGIEEKNEFETINIVHAPSNREIKGTEDIIKAINELKNEGYRINFFLIENMPHNKAVEYYKKADIIIDWINYKYGIYGMFSIENMALGKVIICSIKRNFINDFFKNIPIINSDPENLKNDLKLVIKDYNYRKELSRKSREYVEQIHDAKIITKKILSLYFNGE